MQYEYDFMVLNSGFVWAFVFLLRQEISMASFWAKYDVRRNEYNKPQQAGIECNQQQPTREVSAKVCRKIIRDHLYGDLWQHWAIKLTVVESVQVSNITQEKYTQIEEW